MTHPLTQNEASPVILRPVRGTTIYDEWLSGTCHACKWNCDFDLFRSGDNLELKSFRKDADPSICTSVIHGALSKDFSTDELYSGLTFSLSCGQIKCSFDIVVDKS